MCVSWTNVCKSGDDVFVVAVADDGSVRACRVEAASCFSTIEGEVGGNDEKEDEDECAVTAFSVEVAGC